MVKIRLQITPERSSCCSTDEKHALSLRTQEYM